MNGAMGLRCRTWFVRVAGLAGWVNATKRLGPHQIPVERLGRRLSRDQCGKNKSLEMVVAGRRPGLGERRVLETLMSWVRGAVICALQRSPAGKDTLHTPLQKPCRGRSAGRAGAHRNSQRQRIAKPFHTRFRGINCNLTYCCRRPFQIVKNGSQQ
jgi:hypothetical protein